MKVKRFILFFMAATLIFYSCGSTKADLSAYGDTPIIVKGLTQEEFVITPNELAALKCVSRTAAGKSEKAGKVSAVGPLLNTFLEPYGKKMSDFKKIRFIGSDQYKVVLKDESLTDHEVILSIADGGDPLEESHRPLRILVPDAESNLWAHAIIRIEFEE